MTSHRRRHYRGGSRRDFGAAYLNDYTDSELLGLRFCDLDLRIEGTPLEPRIERLYEELAQRNIRFRPHFWLSDEWFSPDGVPGVAIPFYLAHPRLMRLEQRQMLEVEGGNDAWCMQILRHEAGHAIDTAFRLRRRRRWRETFGKASLPYPEFYHPKPDSKRFVLHLGMWYAQSHPVEDFAETFAVWLKPRSRWRRAYHGWPALKKLQFVDQLMQQIAEEKPKVTSRRHVDALRTNRATLRQHYQKKRAHYGIDDPDVYDRDLLRVFSEAPEHADNLSAAVFLRRVRRSLRQAVAHWTREHQYTIDQVLGEIIKRCRELKLRLARPEEEVERDLLVLLTMQTMNYIHGGRHRVAL